MWLLDPNMQASRSQCLLVLLRSEDALSKWLMQCHGCKNTCSLKSIISTNNVESEPVYSLLLIKKVCIDEAEKMNVVNWVIINVILVIPCIDTQCMSCSYANVQSASVRYEPISFILVWLKEVQPIWTWSYRLSSYLVPEEWGTEKNQQLQQVAAIKWDPQLSSHLVSSYQQQQH